MKPHRGAVILVLGIVGLVVCFPCGIVAWIMGSGDLRQMDSGQMDPSGRGLTQAGQILGIVVTVLAVLSLVLCLVFFGIAGVASVLHSH